MTPAPITPELMAARRALNPDRDYTGRTYREAVAVERRADQAEKNWPVRFGDSRAVLSELGRQISRMRGKYHDDHPVTVELMDEPADLVADLAADVGDDMTPDGGPVPPVSSSHDGPTKGEGMATKTKGKSKGAAPVATAAPVAAPEPESSKATTKGKRKGAAGSAPVAVPVAAPVAPAPEPAPAAKSSKAARPVVVTNAADLARMLSGKGGPVATAPAPVAAPVAPAAPAPATGGELIGDDLGGAFILW